MNLSPNQYFLTAALQQKKAHDLYDKVANLPLICPYGHVDSHLFSRSEHHTRFTNCLMTTPTPTPPSEKLSFFKETEFLR